jgi:hypothetical protein
MLSPRSGGLKPRRVEGADQLIFMHHQVFHIISYVLHDPYFERVIRRRVNSTKLIETVQISSTAERNVTLRPQHFDLLASVCPHMYWLKASGWAYL